MAIGVIHIVYFAIIWQKLEASLMRIMGLRF